MKDEKKHKNFCPLPWMLLATRNDGRIRLCAQSQSSQSKGVIRFLNGKTAHIQSNNLEQIRNSASMNKIRKTFLKGEFPEACHRCKKEREAGLRSRPDYESEIWREYITSENMHEHTNNDGSLKSTSVPILYLDIRLGNLCNLACRTCSPGESSRWYRDHIAVWGPEFQNDMGERVDITEGMTGRASYGWANEDLFCGAIEESLKTVQKIHFSGGEPLLIQKHTSLLKRLVEMKRAGEVKLDYITNGTVFPNEILGLWESFKEVKIGISIDGFGQINDYIRYPSNWNKIEEGINYIDSTQYSSQLTLTMSAYNIWYLPEIIAWRLNRNFQMLNADNTDAPLFSDHPVHNPKFLNIKVFPDNLKRSIEEKLRTFLISGDLNKLIKRTSNPNINMQSVEKLVEGYIHFMNSEDLSEHFSKFILYTNKLDKLRKQSLKVIMPSFYELLTLSPEGEELSL